MRANIEMVAWRKLQADLAAALAQAEAAEAALAKYQAARIHDVDEKNWLRDRLNEARAALAELRKALSDAGEAK